MTGTDETVKLAQSLNAELRKMELNTDWFSSKDIKIKTDVTELERSGISYLRAYSKFIGGLPGIDELLDEYDLYGRSLNRRSSIEWVETFKSAVANLAPNLHFGAMASEKAKRNKKFWEIWKP